MALNIRKTNATDEQRINALIYGNAGAGKTTMALTVPEKPLVISAEAGLMPLADAEIDYIEVKTIGDVHEAYSFINSGDHDYKWIVIDSISEIAEVLLAEEMEKNKDPRKAYGETQMQMMGLIRAFRDLPFNVYMTAKQERVKDDMTGMMLYSPAMVGTKLGQQIPYLFDLVFALRIEKDAEGKDQRWLQTSGDNQYIAKDRSGKLEQFEQPNINEIVNKIRN